MDVKRHKPEEIVHKLRQVEVLVGQGIERLDAFWEIGRMEKTYYRWHKQYGGTAVDKLTLTSTRNQHHAIEEMQYQWSSEGPWGKVDILSIGIPVFRLSAFRSG